MDLLEIFWCRHHNSHNRVEFWKERAKCLPFFRKLQSLNCHPKLSRSFACSSYWNLFLLWLIVCICLDLKNYPFAYTFYKICVRQQTVSNESSFILNRCSEGECIRETGTLCDGKGECSASSNPLIRRSTPPGYPNDECHASCPNRSLFNCTRSGMKGFPPSVGVILCASYVRSMRYATVA